MQSLGNLIVPGQTLATSIVVIVFDQDNVPQFAMIQESPNDFPLVVFGDYKIETRGIIDSCSFTSGRPQNGGGIRRRSGSINVLTEHAKGYPFFKGPIKKALYYGGQSVDDLYFGVYVIDRSKQFEDIRSGLFLGYYRIESGVKWTEKDGTTSIPFVDILQQERYKVGATGEDIPEQFFLFNPWYNGEIIPKVWGQVPRVRMLNVFPTISTKKVAGSISGRVESNYTNASTSIVLEKYADRASVLRQLAELGYYVRVRFKDSEVMRGTLSYNSGTGEVTFNITDRNTYYAKAKGYTNTMTGETPEQWESDLSNQRIPISWSLVSSVLINGKTIVQDSNGWLQADVQYFNNSEPDKNDVITTNVQLEGWEDEDRGIIRHKMFLHSGDASTLSFQFSSHAYGVVQTGIGPVNTWTWTAGTYLTFKDTAVEVKLFFRDPATAAGSGSIGDGWSVVGIEPSGAVDYSCFIRNGFSHFDNDHVYAEGDGRLIKIPTANIVSVTDSTTAYGLDNMCKITLTAAPVDMDIGATSNVVYTDAMYRTGDDENRTERILNEILKESYFLHQFAGVTISDPDYYASANWLPYVGVLARTPEELVSVIDKLLFQIGCSLTYISDKYELQKVAFDFNTEVDVTISGNTYVYPNLEPTDGNEMMENSAEIDYGNLISIVDEEGYEYIPLYYDIEYGGWEDPNFKRVTPLINTAIRSKDHKFKYKFDYINDPNSANYATSLSLSIGHPSGLYAVERYLNCQMTVHGFRWDAMDPIVFRDFPLISTSDETNAVLDDDNHPQYLKPTSGRKFIMGAVCVVDNINYVFGVDEPPHAVIQAKMAQTFVNANGIGIYAPPYPPLPPPPPPSDPNLPPNPAGGSAGTFAYGGSPSPMPLIASLAPESINIDSIDDYEITVSIDCDGGMVFAGGWDYLIEIVAEDGSSYSTDGDGASITPGVGFFSNKVTDPFDPPAQIHTLTVNYQWFASCPIALISRPIKLRIHRYYGIFRDRHMIDELRLGVIIDDPEDLIIG